MGGGVTNVRLGGGGPAGSDAQPDVPAIPIGTFPSSTPDAWAVASGGAREETPAFCFRRPRHALGEVRAVLVRLAWWCVTGDLPLGTSRQADHQPEGGEGQAEGGVFPHLHHTPFWRMTQFGTRPESVKQYAPVAVGGETRQQNVPRFVGWGPATEKSNGVASPSVGIVVGLVGRSSRA